LNGQPSISSLFRGMVMLGGLIAIPAIALFGSGLTEAARQFVQRQLGINAVSAATTLSEAPPFTPTVDRPSLSSQPLVPSAVAVPVAAPGAAIPSAGNPTMAVPALEIPQAVLPPTVQASVVQPSPLAFPQPAGMQNVVPTLNVAPPGTGAVQAIGYDVTRTGAGPSFVNPGASQEPAVQLASSVYESGANLVPVPRATGAVGQAGLPSAPATMEGGLPVDNTRRLMPLQATSGGDRPQVSVPAPFQDRFASMHQRLRESGATYCLLESWGPQSDLYRFHCKMSIGGSTNYTRSFEATDPDPLGAVAKVVEQVEQWRSGRP